jgi:signal transduction histidine kinase
VRAAARRKQLEKIRNDRRNQTSQWLNVAVNCFFQCLPPILLALAAVSRLRVALALPAGPAALRDTLASPYIIFGLSTALIWGALLAAVRLQGSLAAVARQRRWRLWRFWLIVAGAALVVAYFAVFVSSLDPGAVFQDLVLVLYANANLLVALHRAATNICVKNPRTRAAVDAGFLAVDAVIGYTMLAVVGLLSFVAIVGKAQATLLFNSTFAKSVRRGKLVRTVAGQKTPEERRREEADATAKGAPRGGGGGGAGAAATHASIVVLRNGPASRGVSSDGLVRRG